VDAEMLLFAKKIEGILSLKPFLKVCRIGWFVFLVAHPVAISERKFWQSAVFPIKSLYDI
jgi:hypothetical protein